MGLNWERISKRTLLLSRKMVLEKYNHLVLDLPWRSYIGHCLLSSDCGWSETAEIGWLRFVGARPRRKSDTQKPQ